jgi:hypothetical protein
MITLRALPKRAPKAAPTGAPPTPMGQPAPRAQMAHGAPPQGPKDQKNRDKNNKRTQRRTHHIDLCPVKRSALLIGRIIRLVPTYDDATTLNTVIMNGVPVWLTQ